MPPPHLYLRADADMHTGVGHVVRSHALAQAWHDLGGQATLLVNADISLPASLRASGLQRLDIRERHPDSGDLNRLLRLVRPGDWVACDGYHFDAAFCHELRSAGIRVLVIDDVAHQPTYEADILVNQNIEAERLRYRLAIETPLMLLGPKYALLRREFRLAKPRARSRAPARRVLVLMGGSDPHHQAERMMSLLIDLDDGQREVRIVVGPSRAARAASWGNDRTRVIVDPLDLTEQMSWAELAVSAGGSTCWELCRMGVAIAVVTISRNQARIAAGLHRAGAAVHLGWFDRVTDDSMRAVLGALMTDGNSIASLSRRALALVDGAGAMRIAAALQGARTRVDGFNA